MLMMLMMLGNCSCGPIDAVARLSVGFRRAPVNASPAHAALSPSVCAPRALTSNASGDIE